MDEKEKQFIYERMHFMNEQLQHQEIMIDKLLDGQEKLAQFINLTLDRIELISSSDYHKKINQHIDNEELRNKLKMVREMLKKNTMD